MLPAECNGRRIQNTEYRIQNSGVRIEDREDKEGKVGKEVLLDLFTIHDSRLSIHLKSFTK